MADSKDDGGIRRSKNFLGCFTCRLRKIRCDLHKPSCKNCTKARIICLGYDIKLRWSLPLQFKSRDGTPISSLVVFKPIKDEEEGDNPTEYFQRRHVGFVVWDEKLNYKPYTTYEELDDHLADVNAQGMSEDVLREGQTRMKGPFGVFKGSRTKRHQAQPSLVKKYKRLVLPYKIPPSVDNTLKEIANDNVWLSNELRDDALLTAAALNGDMQLLEFMMNNNFSVPQQENPNDHAQPETDLMNLVLHRNTHPPHPPADDKPEEVDETLEIQLHASKIPTDEETTDIVEGDTSNTTTMPEHIMNIVKAPLSAKIGFDVALPNVNMPITALLVQPLARYLLNHYINQVADLMTVIPLTENPWKTIYFPKALLAIGELSSLGQTSPAKNALLNALLAVSAFNLQSKFPKNSEQMRYYLNLGIRLRNQASLFVRKLLGSNNDASLGIEQCVQQEKYKDVLCAVMSMISVDLVWGTMQDTNFYITWCGRVIQTKMATKKKMSSKARILHRIFSSMKLIQDSTCLDLQNIKDTYENDEYDVNGDKFDQRSKGRIDFIMDTSRPSQSPQFMDKKLVNTKKNDENFATDALYGLPNLLILLFSETVHLLRTKINHLEKYHELPANFQSRVHDLQHKLTSWTLDWKLRDELAQFTSPMHEATYHHILSFYHALTIYFKRLIKEVPPTEVQDTVERTLEHLNSIQRLISRGEADIIPLFWQGFIAGCEALSLNLQMGFKKWGADIAQYLGSYWGARQIMLEVWRRKRMKEARDDWVSVIKDWEMNLMLN